jgi:cobalamin 5'-phosphate synthase/cobalamin synthase
VRRLAVAIAFLTRIPVPGAPPTDGAEIGRAAGVFPAAGALLGGILAGAGHVLALRLPAALCAAILVALLTLLTGALHLDGLADMADGFGGGRKRDDVLRIMRDHAIGAYGASALVLALLVKVAAIAALLAAGHAAAWLLVAPALARWTPAALGCFLPYARAGGGLGTTVTEHSGMGNFALATALALAVAVAAAGLAGGAAFLAVAAFTALHGAACRRRIGGITGDTLGASIEAAEVIVLVLGVANGA